MSPVAAPEPQVGKCVRLDASTLPVTWPAAVFALLVGLTMVFVPYEFQARLFRTVYPYVRLLGLAFLAGALGLAFGATYSRARWADRLGRVVLTLALVVYWWEVNVRTGGHTGSLLYPLLMVVVAAEAHPRFARGGLLGWFFALVAVGFGGLILLAPGSLAPDVFMPIHKIAPAMGLAFLATGATQIALRVRRSPHERWSYLGHGVLFLFLAIVLGNRRAWTGMELYLVLAASAALVAWAPCVRRRLDLRARLLRSMAVAALLPLFAAGGLASYFAQRELETGLQDAIGQATGAEAAWLSQQMTDASDALEELGRQPDFAAAADRRDQAAVAELISDLRVYEPLVSDFFVQDRDGVRWMATSDLSVGENRANRDYHQRVLRTGAVFISPPYVASWGAATVVIAAPIQSGRDIIGVVGGAIDLRALAALPSQAAVAYGIQVVDRRTMQVVRDNNDGPLAVTASLPPPIGTAVRAGLPGIFEVFDEQSRSVLMSSAPVPGTDWVVIASQHTRSAYAPLTRTSGVVAFIVIAAASLAVLLSRFVSREFAARIGGVQAATRALAGGDLGRRVADGNQADELGQLAQDFNHMADRIQNDQAELARVNERLRQTLEARDNLTAALRLADRRKDEFLATLGHELRNPLAALAAAMDLLERGKRRPEVVERVLPVGHRQVRNLTRMVEDLLDVSRIASNKITLRKERTDVRVCLEHAAQALQGRAAAVGHTLSLDVPVRPLWVDGDATRLEQVFSNLLQNSVKYTPDGGRIVATASVTERGDEVRVQVTDNGRGISPELLPHVFELFVQEGGAAERPTNGGLGLGLTLVRRLVELHGGHVTADSLGPGRGSTFTVVLPAARAADHPLPARPVDAAVVPLAAGATFSVPNAVAARPVEVRVETPPDVRRIVLVDDNMDAADLMKELLETYGHHVAVAHDGEDGRNLILDERPDVAFVDIGLPKMDGFEVARQVRNAGLGTQTRLVALTGYGGADVRSRAVAAGFDEHVVKPLDFGALERLLS